MESEAKIAQLGERMTEDHKVRCSIHLLGAFFFAQGVENNRQGVAKDTRRVENDWEKNSSSQ